LKVACCEGLAVKSHDYLLFDLNSRFSAQAGLQDWGWSRADKNRLLIGIVKDAIFSDCVSFSHHMLPKMQQDILNINRLGIVARDVRVENYVGGRLFDFSQASTVPHFDQEWNSAIYSREHVMGWCTHDFLAFDALVDDLNDALQTKMFWRQFFPNIEFGKCLRDPSRYLNSIFWFDLASFPATSYNWERKPAERRPYPQRSESLNR
jgi:hypothetical protein